MRIFTRRFSILIFMIIQVNIFSQTPNVGDQIPNAGFENWIDQFTPQDWTSNNAPPTYTTVQRTSTVAMGTYALQLQIANSVIGPVPPFMQSNYFPVSQSYGSIMGYYQLQQVNSSEVIYISAFFIDDGNFIGVGSIDIGTPASSYTPFSLEIEYFGERSVPDSAYIWIGMVDTSETNPHVAGGIGLIDELSFGPPVGVHPVSSNIPDKYKLTQNYPNPFNPSTKINFSLPEQSYVELIVYDILGNEITKLINNNYSAGEYAVDFIADNLPAGIYLARLSAGKYSTTIKMTLLK